MISPASPGTAVPGLWVQPFAKGASHVGGEAGNPRLARPGPPGRGRGRRPPAHGPPRAAAAHDRPAPRPRPGRPRRRQRHRAGRAARSAPPARATTCATRPCRFTSGCGTSPRTTSSTPTAATARPSGAASTANSRSSPPSSPTTRRSNWPASCSTRSRRPPRPPSSRELQRRLDAAIADLDEDDREVILMRHGEQLSNQEVAAALGLTEAAASMRYLRAVRRLRGRPAARTGAPA